MGLRFRHIYRWGSCRAMRAMIRHGRARGERHLASFGAGDRLAVMSGSSAADACPCGSGSNPSLCCLPLLSGEQHAATAEQLMRSRYTAYARGDFAYLVASTHPDQQLSLDPDELAATAEVSNWKALRVLSTQAGGAEPDCQEGWVEFEALFESAGKHYVHAERSHFIRHTGRWYYDLEPGDWTVAERPSTRIVERNETCPCGSGRKLKKCCGAH